MPDEKFQSLEAVVSWLPYSTGDGYGWGGGVILTIGSHSIPLGEGPKANALANEIASRWNAGRTEQIKF